VTECDRWGGGGQKIEKNADVVFGQPLTWVESANEMNFKVLPTNAGEDQSVMILLNQALHDIED